MRPEVRFVLSICIWCPALSLTRRHIHFVHRQQISEIRAFTNINSSVVQVWILLILVTAKYGEVRYSVLSCFSESSTLCSYLMLTGIEIEKMVNPPVSVRMALAFPC